ncbi:hypothetical protein SEA_CHARGERPOWER_100 [Mycobacterium phage Chargerpower]|nr:hypothetical protein SEA_CHARGERPOWER_100 [Mycobacterium phage Chargerpower]
MTPNREKDRFMSVRKVYIQGIGWVYCRGNSVYRVGK